jgi:uncharacterized membrane protein YidH (DUF202 family)
MNASKMIGVLLIVGGLLGLAYGGFSYTKETHKADLGPVQIKLDEKEHVNIPLWASIAAIIGGGALLLTAPKI